MGAKLLAATHVAGAKVGFAKLVLATHMGKLVIKVAVPILVEDGKMMVKLLAVLLLPFAGDA